jgi:LysR family transcriptional regulator, glycine cleavage system transcriptional activator
MNTDLRFPSIEGLRAFEAAARLGSFERAADELHITASAVSKRVATVEELLGTPLLLRGPRALTLTTTGREYLEQVRQALALLAGMPQHQRAQQRLQKLRVSTPPTFARQILVPGLESFTAAHPQIELEVVLSIPFLGGPAPDADIQVQAGAQLPGTVLLHDRVLPLAAPALLARLPTLLEPTDLAHAPLLRTPLEPWVPWFRTAGLPWPEPTAGPKLVDLGLTLEAAVAGQGVALGRPTLARHWIGSGALVSLFKTTAAASNLYTLLPHAATGAAAVFAVWLRTTCAQIDEEAQALISGPA